MSFSHEKQQFLNKPDKSSAGGIDKAIASLCKKINSMPEYFTTSSCAGRIILMPETGKKQKNVFLFRTHNSVNIDEIINSLKNNKINAIIYLKLEPCIMHVACKNIEKAQQLVSRARNSGWKKSGIISIKPEKIICELVSTEILAAPIADKSKILVNDNYLKILANEANKKLIQTRQKIKKLEKSFEKRTGLFRKFY